jgi:hypothetical protein
VHRSESIVTIIFALGALESVAQRRPVALAHVQERLAPACRAASTVLSREPPSQINIW